MPLREYIEHLYLKRFGKSPPDNITSIEEIGSRAAEERNAACIQREDGLPYLTHSSRQRTTRGSQEVVQGEFEEVIMIEVVDRKSAIP
jgi:hypothetical protein